MPSFIIYFDIASGSSIFVIIRVYSRPYIIKAGIIEYLNIPTRSNIFPISVIDSRCRVYAISLVKYLKNTNIL
jgi:hypothetical protein